MCELTPPYLVIIPLILCENTQSNPGSAFSIKIIELLHNFNAKPLCIVNCLNYGDPNNCINDLINFIQDLNNFCKANNIPVVGGNVSLYNSTNNLCIEPTPIIVLLALIS